MSHRKHPKSKAHFEKSISRKDSYIQACPSCHQPFHRLQYRETGKCPHAIIVSEEPKKQTQRTSFNPQDQQPGPIGK